MKARVWFAAALCAAACAADSGIRGPVAGFVLDRQAGAIRPVNGIPGAAVLGGALPLPVPVREAAIAPQGRFALVISAEDRAAYVVTGLAEPGPMAARIEGAIEGAGFVALNAPGDAALLYAPSSGRLQVITGLPGAPRAGAPLDAAPAGEVGAMALSADASRIVAATTGETGAVYEWQAAGDSPPRLLMQARGAAAVAFTGEDRDLLVAKRETNEIVLLRGIQGNGDISVLAGEAEGVRAPVAVRSIDGGREIWIANAGSNSILALDMTTPGRTESLPLAGAPTRCEPLDGRSLLVLNEAGRAPLLIADWGAARGAYFVPAPHEEAQ